MSGIGVDLSVDGDVTVTELHDRWLWVCRRRNEAQQAATVMWREWKDAYGDDDSAEADFLWQKYCALQSDYRVLAAWTDVVHAAWVFAGEGRNSRFRFADNVMSERIPTAVS